VKSFRPLGIVAVVLVLLAGCAKQSPEERIAALRSHYGAELNGFLVTETPLDSATVPAPDEEGGGEAPAVEPVDGQASAPGEPQMDAAIDAPVRTVILLDLLVHHSSTERLPGVTVDVSMVDSQRVEKGHWKIWVETADLAKATHKQVSENVEVDGYEEGDGFFAEVRHPIPPAERGEYREFSMEAPE
jgi:hypothetical protein